MKARSFAADGVVAGLLGGLVVAAWFLLFDALRNQLFQTPNMLSAVILHGYRGAELAALNAARIFEYTLLHFFLFALLGLAIGWLMRVAEGERPLLIALVIFFAVFEAAFVVLVMALGPTLSAAVTWWSVLVGNLLATATILGFFLVRYPKLPDHLLGEWKAVISEGVIAGLIGGSAVAIWFLVHDFAFNQPLRTPALLGATLLGGFRDLADVKVTTSLVLGYSVFHFTAFVIFGVLAATLLAFSEREPLLLLLLFVLFACFEVFFLGLVILLDQTVAAQLGWTAIVVGNVLASAAMLGFFVFRHRTLHLRLAERWASQQQ